MKKLLSTLFILAMASSWIYGQNQNTDTNKAHIESLFREMHDAATWGLPTTNGIQLGVAIFNGKGVKQFRTFTYLYDETNFWVGLYPPNGYRLNLSLRDADGKNVEKTKEGKAISKPIGLIVKTQIWMRSRFDLLPQKTPMRYENPFNLLDCFKVEKPGTNSLTIGGTVYKRNNNGGIFPIVLPPVSMKVPVTQADVERHKMPE